MDKFFRKTKGAISIFLVIVLLPMMTVASVFVDMSRINLAKSMAESAGDLTLNTALTNYDAEMKNLYGLFATSQNMEDLMASLEDYYRDSIIAAGVDSAAADDYVGQIMDYLKTTTGTDDIMDIELTGFEVSAPEGGNLGNPAILKSQIVEFMKYRAPLSLGTGFLDALSTMKDLSKQTELVEDKNKFYEEHQNLLGNLEEAWREIQAYQYASATVDGSTLLGFPTGTYISDNFQDLTEAEPLLDSSVSHAIKYLQDLNNFKKLQYDIKLNQGTDTSSEADDYWEQAFATTTLTKVSVNFTEDDPATTDDILEKAKDTMLAIKSVESYTKTDPYKYIFELPNSADAVQEIYAVKLMNKNGGNYFTAVKNLLGCLVTLDAALKTCTEDVNINYNWDQGTLELASQGGISLRSIAQGYVDDHLNLDQGGYFYYFLHVINKSNGYYSEHYNSIYGDSGYTKTVKSNLLNARKEATDFYSTLSARATNLTNAISKLTIVKNSLSNSDSEYQKALKAWETSASNLSDNTMGKNDAAEIEELKNIITLDRVNDLITRLQGAETTVRGYMAKIEMFTYEGTKWKEIPSDSTYSKMLDLLTSSHKSTASGIKPTSASSYDDVINAVQGDIGSYSYTQTWTDSQDSDPNLTHKQVKLYTWLYNNFYDANMNYDKLSEETDKTASGDSDMTSMESDLKKQADDLSPSSDKQAGTVVDRDVSQYLDPELKALPSTRWNETQDAIAAGKIETNADNMLKESNKDDDNMLETLLSIASNMGTELRDNLYVTEYIMSMFSYDTIEAETYVEESGQSIPTSGISFYNAPVEGSTEYTVKDEYAQYAAMIETMTNNSINPNMNYLYGEEVEYILYGESGATGVYGTIFVLRFALNTVYAFTDAEINNITLSAATAIFGTPPLTPLIPFAKAAMTIGLAIAESSWDLVELRKGEAVPLMKNSQTWIMKPSGIASEVKNLVIDEAKKMTYDLIDEGYKVLNEAIAMTSDELQAMINGTGQELKNLSDAATTTVKDQIVNKANEALQEVVELCNLTNQQAMLEENFQDVGFGSTPEKVQTVINKLNEWLANQSQEDPAIYQAKRIAVEYITAENGKVISELFDSIKEQTSDSASGSADPNNILAEKLELIKGEIDTKINSAIDSGVEALGQVAKDIEQSLKDAAAEGADKLKETLGGYIDSAFSGIPDASNKTASSSTTMASLLSWRYSDYLRVFVVVGMFANEELMLLRIADMIELNMQKKNNEYAVITTTETVTTSRFFGLWKTTEEKEVASLNNAAFSLSKSYTYLTINATLQVKPLLMTLPFMADTVENQLTGTNWYEIEYTGTLGY